ncbi:MAG: aldo/keto reductase [Candidatus Omnitrophota bacterium]
MKYSKIAETDLMVSSVSLGTWALGGLNWGDVNKEEAIGAVHAAIDHGISLIDTAPFYGYGNAERLIGEALVGRREKVVLATKCGLVGKGKGVICCLKPESIRKEINDSLVRLRTNYIDLYQCHWPDESTPIEDTVSCLKDLQAEGKIRYIGVSNFLLPLLKKSAALAHIVTLQSHLSLLQRQLQENILPYCAEHGIGVLTYGSLGGGILTGKYARPKDFPKDDARSFFYKFYKGEKFNQVKIFQDKLRTLDLPLNQIALNWVRHQKGIISVLAGCRNARQVIDNIEAVEWDLNPGQLAFIDKALEECNL